MSVIRKSLIICASLISFNSMADILRELPIVTSRSFSPPVAKGEPFNWYLEAAIVSTDANNNYVGVRIVTDGSSLPPVIANDKILVKSEDRMLNGELDYPIGTFYTAKTEANLRTHGLSLISEQGMNGVAMDYKERIDVNFQSGKLIVTGFRWDWTPTAKSGGKKTFCEIDMLKGQAHYDRFDDKAGALARSAKVTSEVLEFASIKGETLEKMCRNLTGEMI